MSGRPLHALQSLWRQLPEPLRVRFWQGLDGLGAWPVRIGAGPARGLVLLAPASRRAGYRAARYERSLLDLLGERLRPGMEMVDAGAFLGYLTLAAARLVGDSGRVWAFEPQPRSRSLLERTLERNRLSWVTVVPAALGAGRGEGFIDTPANPALARLVQWPGPGRTPVPVISLDDWCAESGARPALIKLDVEGAELEVLRGAVETLRRHRPVLAIEVHRGPGLALRPERLLASLGAAGYRVRPLARERGPEVEPLLRRLAESRPAPGRLATIHLLATPG